MKLSEESEIAALLETLRVMGLKQFVEKQLNFPIKNQLSVLESWDLNFSTCQKISNGCNGVVCKIKVNVDEFKKRTCTNCPIDELAIKMMLNFIDDKQSTIIQKRKFDKEYIFPLAHPHWSHVQIFNYFRAKTVDSLIDQADKYLYADTTTYFTMELCKSNLKNYINENNNISVPSALLMIYQLLDGVKHLYDHEVVHLDLKADNIFIADRKIFGGIQVVIGDFGTIHPFIYKELSMGNPVTSSPELLQFRKGDTVDISKNDIWAIGCIFFQLLEGKHPFDDCDYKHNICNGRLPLTAFDKHGDGTKQFLQLLWNRDQNERIDPKIALVICGLLLWGAPTVEKLIDYTPFDLQTNLNTFCTTTCKQYSELDCKQWLRHKINTLHTSFSQNQNNELSFILQVHFLISTSASELLGCMKILSTIYDPNK